MISKRWNLLSVLMFGHYWNLLARSGRQVSGYSYLIESIEKVQRRFTKQIPGLRHISYQERLKRLNKSSLELRRLHSDLIWCFKIVFGYVDVH